jgi:GT2 family glycosyltransferase
VPTLSAGVVLRECVQALQQQHFAPFEIIIVDNSGTGLVRGGGVAHPAVKLIENEHNVGFGAAVNQGVAATSAPLIAVINDDAVASPEWLCSLVAVMESREDIGMCASQVRLLPGPGLDSAGMQIALDGSSKQRGHHAAPADYAQTEEVLFPSGSAALYRRSMLEQVGRFDEEFFLYCEDTDLGLRALRAGWRCVYVAGAVVSHRYSQSAGRASALKAYYVERNRLFVIVKNFPKRLLLLAPAASMVRYAWHLHALVKGHGITAEYARGATPIRLAWYVIQAHLAACAAFPRLWSKRQASNRIRRLSGSEFTRLILESRISLRQVAAL